MGILETVGGIVVALVSGAGGAVLLEVFWKPRRDRRKAATLLLAEILLNTELLLMQTRARQARPKSIPGDFHMSTLAWDTVSNALVELPAEVLKSVLLLYNRYRDLNTFVGQFAEALRDVDANEPGSAVRLRAERHSDVIIDVFNTSIDSTIDHAKKLSVTLFKIAGIKPTGEMDYEAMKAKVDRLFEEREERIRRLNQGRR